jgi:hypothetical protein
MEIILQCRMKKLLITRMVKGAKWLQKQLKLIANALVAFKTNFF